MEYMSLGVLSGLQSCNYSAMAALAFTMWDICITLDDEVGQIWRKPWTHLKSFYIFLRSFSLGSQLISAIVSLKLAAGFQLSPRGCRVFVGFQGLSSQLLQMAVQVLIILRLQALYNRNKLLRLLLPCCFLLEVVIMTVIFASNFASIEYSTHCTVVYVPVAIVGFFGPPIIFESVLFVLTMVKFYIALRDGWGQEPMISRFLKDGIWAFALPFVSLMVNTCCMALLDNSISTIAFAWVIAIPGFAGYRLILNMGHLLQESEREDSIITTQTFATVFDPSLTMTELQQTPIYDITWSPPMSPSSCSIENWSPLRTPSLA